MSTPTIVPQDPVQPPASNRRRRLALVAAAAAVVVAAGLVVTLRGGDEGTEVAAPPVELSLGSGPGLASCLAPEAGILADMSPALAATVTAVDGESITLTVDRWYAGGEADTVVLHADQGMEALIGGIDFRVGEQYLLTAADGVVNYCGYSGPASDAGLAALFAEAFDG